MIIAKKLFRLLFYAGIAINVFLLRVSIPGSINILIISILILLVVMQGLLTYVQSSKLRYLVYKNRIQIEGAKQEYIMFNTIQELKHKRNFFDKMFNTGTLVIGPKKNIIAVPNFDQNFLYISQMIQYSRMQYNRL